MEQLFVIYDHYHHAERPGHYIVTLFTEQGKVDRDQYIEVFKESFGRLPLFEKEKMGPFENLDQLKKFVYELGTEIGVDEIRTLSTREYNQVFEGFSDFADVYSQLKNIGDFMPNIEKSEPSSFLDKWFS